ncbi:MAG: hypothetical protein WBF71_13015 [Microthrixaceae bacterium]
MATPLESFDPLLSPGFGLGLVLWGLIDTSGALSSMGGTPVVATGWQEVDERSDGTRRFERTLPAKTFTGEREAGGPVERLEERAVTNRFYELAELTAIVELGPDGKLARYTVRSEFEGDPDFPDCGPLTRAVGTANLVTEFSDVGTKFKISVPDPSDLVGAYPLLAEPPDLSDDFFDSSFDGDFRNEAGQHDLTGCPTP